MNPPPPPKPLHMQRNMGGVMPIVDLNSVNSSISIDSAAKIHDGGDSYVVYNIQVRLPKGYHTVSRRFREFVEFHRFWSQQYKGIRHVNLPPRKLFRTAKSIDTRRRQLEQYLRDVSLVSALRHEVAEFLEVDEAELKKMLDLDKEKMGPMPGTLPRGGLAAMGLDAARPKRYSTGGFVHIETSSPVITIPPPPQRPEKAEPVFVPGGDWERFYDAGEKEYYYYNKATGETTWDVPPDASARSPPPPPEKAKQSMRPKIKQMGDMFSTRGAKAEEKVSMRPNIQVMGGSQMFKSDTAIQQQSKAKNNNVVQRFSLRFKANKPKQPAFKMKKSKTTGTSGGTEYRPLQVTSRGPSGSPWRAAKDPSSGDVYYYHKTTGETSWEEPPGWIDSSAAHRKPSVRVPDDFTVQERIRQFNEL